MNYHRLAFVILLLIFFFATLCFCAANYKPIIAVAIAFLVLCVAVVACIAAVLVYHLLHLVMDWIKDEGERDLHD